MLFFDFFLLDYSFIKGEGVSACQFLIQLDTPNFEKVCLLRANVYSKVLGCIDQNKAMHDSIVFYGFYVSYA